ncbi:MAG: hypothetical protein K6F09_09250 [Clostridiales bacterium]|nr:hypothetical protein [Clostridiales bacterium]
MTADNLLTSVGGVDDALLELCNNIPPARNNVMKWVSAAACIALSALAVTAVIHRKDIPKEDGTGAKSLPASYSESGAIASSNDYFTSDNAAYIPGGGTEENRSYSVKVDVKNNGTDRATLNGGAENAKETSTENKADRKASENPNVTDRAVTTKPSVAWTDKTNAGSGSMGSGDGRSEETAKAETATESLLSTTIVQRTWESIAITTRYPSFTYNGKYYTSRGKAKLGDPVKQVLGEVTLESYDGDKSRTTTAKIMPISSVSPDAAVAVQFTGYAEQFVESGKYYAYVNKSYSPKNLGQLMDDFSLKQNCTFKGVSGCGGDYTAMTFSAPDENEVWKLFDRSAALDTREVRHEETVLIRYSFPLVGYDVGSIGLTADGYMLFMINERTYVFYIGQARAQAFLKYIMESCNPKSLVATTMGYTSAAQRPETKIETTTKG